MSFGSSDLYDSDGHNSDSDSLGVLKRYDPVLYGLLRDADDSSEDSEDQCNRSVSTRSSSAADARALASSNNLVDSFQSLQTWVIKDALQFLSKLPALSDHHFEGTDDTFKFRVEHREFPGVSWYVTLHPSGLANDAEHNLCRLDHWATFNREIKHCWTHLTAELVHYADVQSVAGEFGPDAKKRRLDDSLTNDSIGDHWPVAITLEEVVHDVISLGPNSLTSLQRSGVMFHAWPLDVLQSAVNTDGTLRIRLTLTIYDLDRALRSHDLVRGLHQSGLCSDFTIHCGKEQFPVHKCILAAASCVFKQLFSAQNCGDDIDLSQNATASGLKAFLSLVYYDTCAAQDTDAVVDVLKFAHRFKAQEVKTRVLPVVRTILSVDNVLRVIDASIECDASKVKEACFMFILENREKIQDSDCLSHLLERSDKKEEVCRDFLHSFLHKRLACSSACVCTLPSRSVREPALLKRFPNEENMLTRICHITNAIKRLKQKTVTCKFDADLTEQNGRSAGAQWQLTLYPGGRPQAPPLQRQGYAAFSLNLLLPNLYRLDFPSCWAYVDVRLGAGLAGFEGKEPVQFTAKTEGLTVDKAWHSSVLAKAVKNNAFEIKVTLRTVDVLECLNCHEMAQRIRNDDEIKAKLTLPKLSRSERAVLEPDDESFRSVETWILSGCRDKLAKSSHSFTHILNPHLSADPACGFVVELLKELWLGLGCGPHNKAAALQLSLYASFPECSQAKRFWTRVTADLLRVPGEEGLGENGESNVIQSFTLGPNEVSRGQEGKACCSAWSPDVLQSAIRDDDTIHIRLTFTVYNIQRANKSRELICSLRQNAATSDFALKVGDERFAVHKCVLAAASSEFRSRFLDEKKSSEKILDLSGAATANGVRAFLALVYFEPYDWTSGCDVVGTVCDVLRLANEFKTKHVQDQLLIVMKNVIDLPGVLQLLDAAIATGASRAKELCFTYLLNNRPKLRNSDALVKFLERSEKGRETRREFLQTFFARRLCCSAPLCNCAKPDEFSQVNRKFEEKPFPDEHTDLVYNWTISDAETLLLQKKISLRIQESLAPQDIFAIRRWSQGNLWKLKLYPKGRSLEAQQAGFASVSVCLSSDYFVQRSTDAYLWAFVEATLNVDAESKLRMPFEFSFKTRDLIFDMAWPGAALQKAVNDNILSIQVKVTVVNIPEAIICHEMVQLSLYEQKLFGDFSVKCGDDSILVHKCLLTQRSDVFARMIACEMRETSENSLDLTEVTTPNGIKAFVSAIYFNEIVCDDGDVTMELVKLARKSLDQFGLDDVKAHCDRKLLRHIDMENALEILSTCALYGLPLSKAACVRYLGVNCVDFLKSPAWTDPSKQGDAAVMAMLAKEAIVQLGSLCKSTK